MTLVQIWEMYCDPGPGNDHLGREWRIRKLTLAELGRLPIGGCPERIMAGCTPDDESKFIVASWMAWRDTERE